MENIDGIFTSKKTQLQEEIVFLGIACKQAAQEEMVVNSKTRRS